MIETRILQCPSIKSVEGKNIRYDAGAGWNLLKNQDSPSEV